MANSWAFKARGSTSAKPMAMTPTMELMMPKVSSGVADRAAVAMTVETTAPNAKPAGALRSSKSPTSAANSEAVLKPMMASAPNR